MQSLSTAQDPSHAIGWGVIGASRMARQVMINAIRLQSDPEAPDGASSRVVGIYSHSASRGRVLAEEAKLAHVFESLDTLLGRSDIQCVYISSHPRHQAEMAHAAIEAGKHVLCETPMGLSVEDAVQLYSDAERRGVLLAVNYALRANAALAKVASLIREFAIGEVLGGRISNMEPLPVNMHTWRLEPNGGGIVLDRTIHNIDLVRWLLADEIELVSGVAGKPFLGAETSEVEEDVLGALRLQRSGLAVQFHDSYVALHEHSTLEIYGTGGTLLAYRWWEEWERSRLLLVRNDEVQKIALEISNPYQKIVAAFHEAILARNRQPQGDSVLVTSADAIRNLHVALALREAAQSGQTILLT